ncbi:hypothetical protein V6U90_00745 [Micromonospora sp. CPCC 206060]|uniref:hypothetical protein n=1 Tax=Micromonospora sp. CPCC 206060 TaxID=3122406 RepID=UPI002FEFDEA8
MPHSIRPGSDRLSAFGQELIEIHRWLREELARLRENVEAHLTGGADLPTSDPHTSGLRTRDLRAHCLASPPRRSRRLRKEPYAVVKL